MIKEQNKILYVTIKKLYSREAKNNIQKVLAKTHVADIADVISSFEKTERFDLFKMEASLDRRAEILSHFDVSLQQEILSCHSQEEVLSMVSLMESDDAADLLGYLPEEEAKEILASMVQEDSEEVADLMGYPEDSAGGLMSSDYLALNKNLKVQDVIETLHNEEEEVGAAFYVYVVNDDNKLVGVVSLKQLLLSRKSDLLKDLMFTDVISVGVETHQEKVARLVEHYDFLSIPVVDNTQRLLGVITVDDVIDVIREEAEEDLLAMGQAGAGFGATTLERFKARFGWLLIAMLGGFICFYAVRYFGKGIEGFKENKILWSIAGFIPVMLSVGVTTGTQAATVVVGALRSGQLSLSQFFGHMIIEVKLALVFSVLFGALVYLIFRGLVPEEHLAFVLGLALSLQIMASIVIGNIIPFLFSKSEIDVTVAAIPIYAAIADVFAMFILFGLMSYFI